MVVRSSPEKVQNGHSSNRIKCTVVPNMLNSYNILFLSLLLLSMVWIRSDAGRDDSGLLFHLSMSTLSPDQPACSYLALGDSYTIGESVTEAECWSAQLVQKLRSNGINIAKPDIIARTGWTTSELINAIETHGNKGSYSIVSLLIGVNNQYRGEDIETYRTEFRFLLNTAVVFAGGNIGHVFVLSIPDWGVSPYASSRDLLKISEEIDLFNAVAAEECRKAGIKFIDITPLSRTAREDLTLIASDRLHFSGKMYEQWAAMALPVVLDILK